MTLVEGRHRRWLATLSVALAGPLVLSVPANAAAASLVSYPPPNRSVFEYQVPGTQFNGIVTGADGNLWLTDQANQSIDQLSFSTGVVTAFPIMHPQALPTAITLGADGNVWFLDYNGSYIGKITTAGDITEYSSEATMLTYAIAAGPDGDIWFGDLSPSDIDKITPSGVVTRYPIPQGSAYNSAITGITAGPDGNLWATDSPNNRILKVTTSGSFTAFPLPTPTREPLGITAGPDGNLWFGEQGHGNIGRITTSGVVQEFPINTTNSVQGIAAGPDGNVWFSEAAPIQDMVGMMTVAGRYREFPTPTPQAGPGRPAAGPDGYMWFPEFAGAIAEAAPAGPWPPTIPWYATASTTKSQSGTPHALSLQPKTFTPSRRVQPSRQAPAATGQPNAPISAPWYRRPDFAPILSATAWQMLSKLERLFA